MHRTGRIICWVLAMTADVATPGHQAQAKAVMRHANQESRFILEMQSITSSHDKETVSVGPQGDLELLGTSGGKQIVGLAVTKKDEALEEDSDASPSCHLRKTGFSNGGARRRSIGRTYYLDRHTVDCGLHQVMKQWNLQRRGDDVRIKYECCEVPGGVYNYYERKTTSRNGGDEKSLDGLVKLGAVNCGNNLLQKWKVKRTPFKIEYWCAKPKFASMSGFFEIDGPGNDDGPGLGWPMYLDRHNVSCPAGRYLSKWDIKRTDTGSGAHIKMVYGCVIAETPAPTAAPSPTPSPTPDPTPNPTPSPLIGGACPRGSTLTTIPAVVGEHFASWVLASNGTVFGSGNAIFARAGNINVFTEYLTGVKAIASGYRHTLFLMENGIVCGRGSQLQSPWCDAATSFVTEPVVVMTGVKSFSTNHYTSIFLKETGDLYGCGKDFHGQLGQGSKSSTPRRTPVLVNTNVKSAWAGTSNVLMELLNGSTFVTGYDGGSQFGLPYTWRSSVTGAFACQEVPMELPPPAGLKPFGAAWDKFWYTDAQGTLYGQGMNYYCEMGLPTTGVPKNPRTAPVVDNIKAVASKQTTVFLLKNGTAYTSGDNKDGKVGDGSTSERCGLYRVMDHVQAVATGYSTSFLLAEDGTVYGSGDNTFGQLGNASYGSHSRSFVKIFAV